MDPIDYWIDRITSRADRMFKKWDRLNTLYVSACDRWGPDDLRSLKLQWRLEKFNVRDVSFSAAEQVMYSAIFNDSKLSKFDDALRRYKSEPYRALRMSRRLCGLTFPGK